MKHIIEPRKVAGVVVECNNVIKAKGFTHAEVLVGLSELLGRIIVDASSNYMQADELYQTVQKHIKDTIKIGNEAQGKSLIERV